MVKIGFIGAGTVGTALAVLLDRRGYRVVAVSSRTPASARNLAAQFKGVEVYEHNQDVADAADLVFITTPDAVIPVVAAELKWRQGQSVIHCSGADSAATLEPARLAGAAAGCFHPLQTFAGVRQAIENIPGSTFALEAPEPLLGTLKEMAAALGGYWIELKAGDKAAYHAAAVFACNYMVTLVKLAADLWESFGVPRDQAIRALLPLLRGTLNNIENIGLPGCLTGPIARGDSGTIQKHLETLKKSAPGLLPTYQELGRQTIPIAAAKGRASEARLRELARLLDHA
ncbi:MAG: DUF2520 domain-containing protein [Chloroflexi bacterium]|nr:DUF2520 domain-containing protein [Chloroflexota bacterium]